MLRLRSSYLPFAVLLAFGATLQAQTASTNDPRQPGVLAPRFQPLTNQQKFHYRVVNTFALRGLIGSAFGAGFDQIIGSPSQWGGGVGGYATRYASVVGGALVRQSLNFSFETVLNEDPRYFPLGGPSKKARLVHALKTAYLTRTDSGNTTFAYGRVASAFATGQTERAWLPRGDNGVADGIRIGFVSLGLDAAVNVLYEFVPRVRPKIIREPAAKP